MTYMSYFIFWTSLGLLVYTYFGYPLYMFVRAKLSKNPVKKDDSYKPFVSIIMSAYNEEAYIGRKINNLLQSKYPQDKMEILIGSDGSRDRTNDILLRISDSRVKTFVFQKRMGKPSVLNDLVPKALGSVLIFCDVRQTFNEDAIGQLAANFADDKIGCVSGELIFEKGSRASRVSEGVGYYWEYEKMIRRNESAVHSMVGATGAIYAIRKNLYTVLPKETILDDVYTPLSIARLGYRCIWEEKARAYDRPAFTPSEEYRRKVRTLAGNYQIFNVFKDLLIPFRRAVSIPLISHKLLRCLAPFFMIAMFIANIFISGKAPYGFILICQIIFYTVAGLGAATYEREHKTALTKIASIVYMFCLLNFTAIAGLYRFLSGKQNIAWEK